jgi:hypothetical protein
MAPAIVYAYTTLALDHEEPAAKQVSRLSGLPSSDGIVPDLTPEELRLPRLDRTFELILLPILKQSFPVRGVDPLKNQAWSIFEAVTAEPPTPAHKRSIDRLLSWRFFNGDVVNLEATDASLAQELARAFDGDRIRSSEIPAWGKLWVAKRLGKLLALFVEAFDGIGGINNLSSVEWVCNADGIVLLPQTLSRVWTNLLGAMSITHVPDGPATPLFKVGLYAVTQTLIDIFDRDPVAYMPICLLNEEGQSVLSPSAIRLGVVMHLFRMAEEVLGEHALGTVQIESPTQPRAQDEDEAFGNPTVAGHLLKHILRSKLMTQTMDDKTRERFMELVASLLRLGSAQNTRMLGHVANAMPWIFENHERLQLDVWRTLGKLTLKHFSDSSSRLDRRGRPQTSGHCSHDELHRRLVGQPPVVPVPQRALRLGLVQQPRRGGPRRMGRAARDNGVALPCQARRLKLWRTGDCRRALGGLHRSLGQREGHQPSTDVADDSALPSGRVVQGLVRAD